MAYRDETEQLRAMLREKSHENDLLQRRVDLLDADCEKLARLLREAEAQNRTRVRRSPLAPMLEPGFWVRVLFTFAFLTAMRGCSS